MTMRFLILNGPNLNMLGIREPRIYGTHTYAALCSYIRQEAEKMDVETEFFQSNHEGALIDRIQAAYGAFDAIVLNAGAYTHYSYAILDALKSVSLPTAEVHISDIDSREPFRRVSVIRPACAVTVSGRGFEGYVDAIRCLIPLVKEKNGGNGGDL